MRANEIYNIILRSQDRDLEKVDDLLQRISFKLNTKQIYVIDEEVNEIITYVKQARQRIERLIKE